MMIFDANTIIGCAEEDVVEWDLEYEKSAIAAEARFLRVNHYTFLANMWAGVPLVLEATSEIIFDYTKGFSYRYI